MTIPTLPTELLIKIFSIVSSHSDLYHALLCSKRFAEIVRPFLYCHITIETQLQRENLLRVRKEDKKLVKKLVITGTQGQSTRILGNQESKGREFGVGAGCVKDLLVGKLLDFSSLEVLHVKDVNEEGGATLRELADESTRGFAVKIATNLVELSVSSHCAAGQIWTNVLRPYIVPKLLRLGFSSNSEIYWNTANEGSDNDGLFDGDKLTATREVTLPPSTPFSQLELLVAEYSSRYDHFSEFPRTKALVLVATDRGFLGAIILQRALRRYPHVRFFSNDSHPLDQSHFLPTVIGILRCLSLPCLDGKLRNDEGLKWLTQIRERGVRVHFDTSQDRRSTSIIPQHFVDYMERSKRVECATGDAGEVEGMERLKI